MKLPLCTLVATLTLLAAVHGASADVFLLQGGGRIEGALVNGDESPRRQYVIAVADGSTVTVAADQVDKVERLRPELVEYERICPTYADTPEAQWQLAQWCRERRLPAQREAHLRRIIELDPDHADARHALGYSQLDGQWVTRDDVMIRRGYQRYKGEWKLPQEIELREGERKREASQQEWFQNIKRWRGWIGTDREEDACDKIRAIDNPAAAKALIRGLQEDREPRVRLLYVEALAKLDTPGAASALAIASISDPVEEVRLTCLDRLQTKPRPEAVAYYVGRLSPKKSTNDIINLAAIGLGRMKDPSSIGPLIDALVTIHKFKVNPGGEGATTATFGTGPGGSGAPGGGGGLSTGGGPKIVSVPFSNQAVLDSLIAITGQNFHFDQQAWRRWHAAQKKPPDTLDGRRDD